MINLPRLYENGKFSKLLYPLHVSITDNTMPLSTASMTLPEGESIPVRSWVELYTPHGSAGMFRVRSPHDAYGEGQSSAEMEHMISEVGDWLVKDEINDMLAGTTAISRIFSHYKGGKWKLGNYSAIGSGKVAVDAKYVNVLTALLSILDQKPDCMMTFDFSTSPWTLNFVKKGTKVVAEGRLTRNARSAVVTYDDSELATKVWYQTFTEDKEGNIKAKWNSKSANTGKYGTIEAKVSTSADMTAAEIEYLVNTFLNEHKQPRTSVTINGEDLYKVTGERLDKFVKGDLLRLAIPKYKLTVELNITSVTWSDVYGNPKAVTVQLGEEDTVVTFLHNLDATGSGTRGGGGGGGSKQKQENRWQEFRTRIEEDDYHIALVSEQVRYDGAVLKAAGLSVDSRTGVLIYAKDNKNMIGSKIDTQADRIDLVVSGSGKNAKIKTASIMLGINKDGSGIKLNADRIHLEGYTTLDSFNSLYGQVQTLAAGSFTGVGIRCGTLSVNAAQFTLGVSVVWKSTIKDGDGNTVNVMKWG